MNYITEMFKLKADFSSLMQIFLLQDSPELKYDCQPTFFDCPGLPDTDDKNISGIIRLILDGKSNIMF